MKLLKDILFKVAIESVKGTTDLKINALHFDSRKVAVNDVFFAIPGVVSDGHDFIDKAINQGASVIICERLPELLKEEVTYIKVNKTSEALALMASAFYDHPSESLILVGVTGTNGKTTVASMLFALFKNLGFKTGLLSTVNIKVGDANYKATHTTPDSLTINKYLRQMVDDGVSYGFMEVSSHGIDQNRTLGLHFKGGVFTNLSHDHLDYHNTFSEYRDVKKRFFDQLSSKAFALVNIDDKNGKYMLQNSKANHRSYALKSHADFQGKILENQFSGLLMKINNHEVWTKLIGAFNGYNLLAIYGVAIELGMDISEVLTEMSKLDAVAGRFEYFVSPSKITAIVDYAHTPDALKNVLQTINSIRTKNEMLITVVGCGGDRDKEKRPKMGHIAASLSNTVIFSSDNPRSENPEEIINEIEAGVAAQDYKKTLSITDRAQAIKTACKMASANDIILVAGKGHETYQEINGERFDFDDYEILKDCLTKLNK